MGMNSEASAGESTPTLTVNGRVHPWATPASLAALLDQLGVNRQQVAVEVNEELVPRQDHASRLLTAGDRVEIVTLVGGG